MYPENWKLTDDQLDQLPRTISIQSPSGAFWSVDIHPFSVDPVELVGEVERVMRSEYPDLELHATDEEIGDEPAIGADMFFWCLDFVVTSQVRALRHGHATYLFTCQAEDREFEQFAPVFAAITHSFFRDQEAQ